jgi:hypothetical protein
MTSRTSCLWHLDADKYTAHDILELKATINLRPICHKFAAVSVEQNVENQYLGSVITRRAILLHRLLKTAQLFQSEIDPAMKQRDAKNAHSSIRLGP